MRRHAWSLNVKIAAALAMRVTANGDKIDFDGFMAGYKQFFGTADQPNLPSRSAFKVAGLAVPGWFIEIEVTAVRAETKQK